MKHTATETANTLPWYRYAMVWMVILLPLAVVVASMITIVIAHQNAPVIQRGDQSAIQSVDPSAKPVHSDVACQSVVINSSARVV